MGCSHHLRGRDNKEGYLSGQLLSEYFHVLIVFCFTLHLLTTWICRYWLKRISSILRHIRATNIFIFVFIFLLLKWIYHIRSCIMIITIHFHRMSIPHPKMLHILKRSWSSISKASLLKLGNQLHGCNQGHWHQIIVDCSCHIVAITSYKACFLV